MAAYATISSRLLKTSRGLTLPMVLADLQ